jgi:hypothetical protein
MAASKTKARWRYNAPDFYENTTQETISRQVPVQFCDDFLGKYLNKYVAADNSAGIWTVTETNINTTAGITANEPNGILCMQLDADNNAEVCCVDFGDQLCFDLKSGLVFEARVNLGVLPSAAGVIAAWGLGSARNNTHDTVATNCWFRAEANGAILWETDGGGTDDDDDNATGVTVVNTDWKVYRIEVVQTAADTATVYFYIDGALVGTGGFTALTDAEAKVQPTFQIVKGAGEAVGTMNVDYVKVWQNRQNTY